MIIIGINSIVFIDLSITINICSVYSSFRGLIKDVHVTLTPLTDFEKEIEKSSKRVSLIYSLFAWWGPINSWINNSQKVWAINLLSDFLALFVKNSLLHLDLFLLSLSLCSLLNNSLIISYTCLQLVKCHRALLPLFRIGRDKLMLSSSLFSAHFTRSHSFRRRRFAWFSYHIYK